MYATELNLWRKTLYNAKRPDTYNLYATRLTEKRQHNKHDCGNYSIRDSLYELSYRMDGAIGDGSKPLTAATN